MQLSLMNDPLVTDVQALVTRYGYDAVAQELLTHAPPIPSAPARPTDPITSHLASKTEPDLRRFSDRSNTARLLRKFAERALTDQEATFRVVGAWASPSSFEGCRRRCSDLRAIGFLYDTGLTRHNMGSGDESIVWAITQSGRAAIGRLDATGWSR